MMDRSYGNFIFDLLKNYQTVLQSGKGFLFGGGEDVLKLDSRDGYTEIGKLKGLHERLLFCSFSGF